MSIHLIELDVGLFSGLKENIWSLGHSIFLPLPTEGHLGAFEFRKIKRKTALNICVQGFVWTYIFNSAAYFRLQVQQWYPLRALAPPPTPQAPVSGRVHKTHSLQRYGSFVDSLTRAVTGFHASPFTILIVLTIHFQNMFRNANGLAQVEQLLTSLQPLPAACGCQSSLSSPCLSAADSNNHFSLSTGLSAPQRSFLKRFLPFPSVIPHSTEVVYLLDDTASVSFLFFLLKSCSQNNLSSARTLARGDVN